MNFHEVKFLAAYGAAQQLPASNSPEVSFAGRSNVGKSSLLNRLWYRNGLAKVSSTPGKTATINFYGVEPSKASGSRAASSSKGAASGTGGSRATQDAKKDAASGSKEATPSKKSASDLPSAVCHLVDLPGYGYAKVAKSDKQRWDQLINEYFEQQRNHALVVCLIDVRHDVNRLDAMMVEYVDAMQLPYAIAFTKADKLSRQAALRQAAALRRQLHLSAEIPCVLTSATSGQGVDDLRALITAACQ